jgi:hypothetical protein
MTSELLIEGEFESVTNIIYSCPPKKIYSNRIIPEQTVDYNCDKLNDPNICVFEMLLEFYIEGLCHVEKLKSILNTKNKIDLQLMNSYDNIDYKSIDRQLLLIPEKWIESIGYSLNIIQETGNDYINSYSYSSTPNSSEYSSDYSDYSDSNDCNESSDYNEDSEYSDSDKSDKINIDEFPPYYCKVILKYNPSEEPYFIYNRLSKPYHFIINGKFNKSQKINNIYDLYAILIINSNLYYKIYFSELKIESLSKCK